MNIYIPYVYLIGWSTLDRYYIGSRYSKLECAHPSDLWNGYYTHSYLVKEYAEQYGDPDIIQVRKTFLTDTAAHAYETKVLQRLDARNHPKLLNGHNNDGKFGGPLSEESRQKKNAKLRGRPQSPEHIQKRANARRGQPRSSETKLKQSIAMKGKRKGIPQSPEHIQKRANALKGHEVTKATRQKLSAANKGKSQSVESNLKRSNTLKGRIVSEETRQKMRESAKRRAKK